MNVTFQAPLLRLCLLACLLPCTAFAGRAAALPAWQMLEFEEQAFWATAHSRLEFPDPAQDQDYWKLTADSAIPGNSEHVIHTFEPDSGQLVSRDRLSKGKKDQRLKRYTYGDEDLLRERRAPEGSDGAAPDDWPVTSRKELTYPPAAGEITLTSPYMLLVLAQRLQEEGPGASQEVLVHTDFNFYRARLTCGNGVPVKANYALNGEDTVSGERATRAVALRVSPEGELAEKDDFNLLGLHGDIILLFDRETGLPLQVRGDAPRVGRMEINLKAATLRAAAP